MAGIADACTRCAPGPDGIDQSLLTLRKKEVISGKYPVTRACFVADEIHFKTGQLVFQPVEGVRDYFVVCRKLVLVGGTKGFAIDPCRAGSPGSVYESANVKIGRASCRERV